MAELRKDPVAGTWVVAGYARTTPAVTGGCPFCPGSEQLTPPTIREIRNREGDWLVRCFAAVNSVFVIEVGENRRAEGLYDKMGNVGAHEVVVENRDHSRRFSEFQPDELILVLDMYAERIADLKRDKRFKYVQVYRNHGELAGSYLPHPHSHVLATPILPERMVNELANAKNHYRQKERCLFCDIIAQEVRQNRRVVEMTPRFIAICPFASRFPFEVWILPRQHRESFESIRGDERHELAALMLGIMRKIEKIASSHTFVIHSSTNMGQEQLGEKELPESDYFHWHIEILPRDTRSSRFKREDEFYVMSITAEEAAEVLRAEE